MEYLPLGALIGLVLMSELLIVVALGPSVRRYRPHAAIRCRKGVSNTEALGRIL
jgi:hypothetical protein